MTCCSPILEISKENLGSFFLPHCGQLDETTLHVLRDFITTLKRWILKSGWTYLTTDRALERSEGLAGFRGLLRGNNGKWICCATRLVGHMNSKYADGLANVSCVLSMKILTFNHPSFRWCMCLMMILGIGHLF